MAVLQTLPLSTDATENIANGSPFSTKDRATMAHKITIFKDHGFHGRHINGDNVHFY